jgi:serralysin
VDWVASGGGASGTVAASGADFVGGQLPAGRAQFAAGQATQVITLNVAGDQAAELNESVTVTLLAPQAGVALATASAVGVILNDDHASTAANQALTGTDAADLFLLGGGLDTVTGRGGTDLFLFQPAALGAAAGNATTLADFSAAAGEVLNLAAIDANPATPGDDAFVFIGTAPFSGAPGELRWEDQGTQRMVQGTTNADTTAELTIFVKAAGPVEAGWFVL